MTLTLHQLLFRTFHAQNNVLQPLREELGLGRGQPKMLTYLADHGPSSQGAMANHFDIDPAAVSRMAETLSQNGFLTRTEDEVDRRSKRLELTAKGQKAAEIWKERCASMESRMLDGFSEEEKSELVRLLNRLYLNVRNGGLERG